jgi:hypothetical protein
MFSFLQIMLLSKVFLNSKNLKILEYFLYSQQVFFIRLIIIEFMEQQSLNKLKIIMKKYFIKKIIRK